MGRHVRGMPRTRAEVELSVLILTYASAGLFFGLAMGLRVAARFVDDWRLEVLMLGTTLAAIFAYFMGRFLAIRFKRGFGLYSDPMPRATP